MGQEENYDFLIIGAGAAGLAAAVSFCRAGGRRVLLVEGGAEAGQKILATGNGRCNLSNTDAEGWDRSRAFFESLGLLLDVDATGRVYPYSRRAASVRDALAGAARAGGVAFAPRVRIEDVRQSADGGFDVSGKRLDGTPASPASPASPSSPTFHATAAKVLVATGGKSCPQYGNFGHGFTIARRFGLQLAPIRPGLVPLLYTDEARARRSALKGVRAGGVGLSLLADGRPVAFSEGEIQFVQDGISGICVFDLSLHLREGAQHTVRVDFLQGASGASWTGQDIDVRIDSLLAAGRAAGLPRPHIVETEKNRPHSVWLSGIVHEKLAGLLRREELRAFDIPVKGTRGWKDAQTTVGGILPEELSPDSYEAKRVPGLYFAGEVIARSFPCGGYNLDFAWNSGIAAGASAARQTPQEVRL
jgi:predicted flavoprotein YhiN